MCALVVALVGVMKIRDVLLFVLAGGGGIWLHLNSQPCVVLVSPPTLRFLFCCALSQKQSLVCLLELSCFSFIVDVAYVCCCVVSVLSWLNTIYLYEIGHVRTTVVRTMFTELYPY